MAGSVFNPKVFGRTLALAAALMLAVPVGAQEEAGTSQQQATPQPGVSLEQAYQREFAFLEAQRRELAQRLEQTGERQAAAEQRLRADVDALQSEVVALDGRLERVQEQIAHAEEAALSNEENREVLAATLQQAGATLEQQHDIDALDSEAFQSLPDDQRLAQLFQQGRMLIERLSSIRSESGSFYTTDGREVSGEILRIGNVAAYGRAGDVAGVLAPAGGGRLKVWPVETGGAVGDIMAGQGGDIVPIFLFESLAQAVEARAAKGLVDGINDGGTIGWVIVILGLVVLVMIILRAVFLKQSGADIGKLSERIAPLVRAGKIDEALTALKRYKNAPGRVMAAAVRNLDRERDHIEDIVSEAILHESAHLNRFGTTILVIAAVSPLLGLLGTVTGMISTFDVITEFGTGDPKLLSGGIAIALVTTELGLIVAIPALLLGNLLSGWAESIKDDMEKAALHVINVAKSREALRTAA